MNELLAARGIIVSHEAVRQWALKFGQPFASQARRRLHAGSFVGGSIGLCACNRSHDGAADPARCAS